MLYPNNVLHLNETSAPLILYNWVRGA